MVSKGHDERAPQVAPARDEEHQGGKEQKKLGEGRGEKLDGRLNPVDCWYLEIAERISGAEDALQILPENEGPIEHMQPVLQARGKLGQPRAPLRKRRGDQ